MPNFVAGARRWIPRLAAAAILAFLVREVRPDSLREAFRHGAWGALSAYIILEVVLALAADAFGSREAFAAAGVVRSWTQVFFARGASYLPGLFSYVVGQWGMGYYLVRTGNSLGRSAGAILLMMVVNGIVLVFFAAGGLGIGLVRGGLVGARSDVLALTIAAVLGGTVAYFAIVVARPRRLESYTLLAPLFEAGLAGHLRAILARIPHVLLLVLLNWGAFRIYGIAVPILDGVLLNGVVLLSAALPVTPGGLGTTQALQMLFFSPWADASTSADRAATVLAFSLAHHVIGQLAQAAVGLVCLWCVRRTE
jgi:uncharacterized membrane protein YbhN (UPF0104 family)